MVAENGYETEEELKYVRSCAQGYIDRLLDKKFHIPRLNGYQIVFTEHAKHRIRKRDISLDKIIITLRNIVGFEFIKNHKVLFSDKENSFVFTQLDDVIKVITACNGVIRDDDFDGEIVFRKDETNNLYYYVL